MEEQDLLREASDLWNEQPIEIRRIMNLANLQESLRIIESHKATLKADYQKAIRVQNERKKSLISHMKQTLKEIKNQD